MATIIKANTKKAEQLLDRANYNYGRDLYDVYGSVSRAKRDAMRECKAWYLQDSGDNFRIISYNGWAFSVAWEMTYEGRPATRIETSRNSYIVLHE